MLVHIEYANLHVLSKMFHGGISWIFAGLSGFQFLTMACGVLQNCMKKYLLNKKIILQSNIFMF